MLSVRSILEKDIELIVHYFFHSSQEDLDRMGVDRQSLPSQEKMRKDLHEIARKAPGQAQASYMIWEVDRLAIGFSSLKDIVVGQCGGIHLHMWHQPSRGKGFGAELFCRSALEFYRLYDLPMILCEPSAKNSMPNRMLQKIGFPLKKTYLGRSSSLSTETMLNQYEIRRSIVEDYLDKIKNK